MSHIEVSFETYELFTRALAARWVHHGGRHLTQEEAVREWALRELGSFGIVVEKPLGEAIDVDNAYAQAQHTGLDLGVEPLPTPGEAIVAYKDYAKTISDALTHRDNLEAEQALREVADSRGKNWELAERPAAETQTIHGAARPESAWDAVKADVTRVFGTSGLRRAESLDSALAEAEEAEFTEPPATWSWNVVRAGRVERVAADLEKSLAAAVVKYDTEWPEGYKLYPGKSVTGGDHDITEPLIDSAGGYHFPLDWSADRRQAWYDEQKKSFSREPDYPSDPGYDTQQQDVGQTVPHMTPEEEAVTFGGAGVPFEPATAPAEPLETPQPKKSRRTKAEMEAARNAVTTAYLVAVGDSPWSQGWDVAHEAGLDAANAMGVNAGLSKYQISQVVGSIAQGAKTDFDAAPDRVRGVITSSPVLPSPSDGTERVTWVDAGTTQAGPITPGQTYNDSPPVEVAAIHGLPEPEGDPAPTLEEVANIGDLFSVQPEDTAPSDDDIFRQFLNG